MGKIERFEDLIAWQKARELAREVYLATREGPFARDFGLGAQIQRAAVSVMSNISEGFERASRPEFHRFLSIAKASCAEVRSQLYVTLDVGYLSGETFSRRKNLADEEGRVIGGLRKSVGKPRRQGPERKEPPAS